MTSGCGTYATGGYHREQQLRHRNLDGRSHQVLWTGEGLDDRPGEVCQNFRF